MDLQRFLSDRVSKSTQHRQFYHFTDKRNLESIRKHGLLCASELRVRGIFKDVVTGGDQNSLATDTAKGTDKYVCLCFTRGHPMAHVAQRDERALELVLLEINPEVIKIPNVMITNAASNQTGIVRQAAADALDDLDLDVIYNWMKWADPAVNARLQIADKYEILVPNCVPVEYIIRGL